MTDGGGRGSSRASRPVAAAIAPLAVAAVTVLVLLVAVWAASTGPDDALRGGDRPSERTSDPAQPLETSTAVLDDGTRQPGQPPRERTWITTLLGTVVLTIGVLVALGLLYLLGAGLWRVAQVRRDHRRRDDPAPPLDPLQAVASAIVADADDHEDLLATGSPRNAVVACWHRFEVQAAQAGVPREAWETSSEFTMRLLDLVEADATSVSRLAQLYREARFSEHEVGEESRVAALEVLRSIHRDLRTLLSGGRV